MSTSLVEEDKMEKQVFSTFEEFLMSLSSSAQRYNLRDQEKVNQEDKSAPKPEKSDEHQDGIPVDLFDLKQSIKSQPIHNLLQGIEA